MAIKSETIRARIDPETKLQAEKVFASLGLSATDAITLFYKQVDLHQGLPFPVKIPNADTVAAMEELDAGGGTVYDSAEDMFAQWDGEWDESQ